MRFDAPVFAKAWLAVALASTNDKNLVAFHKTVALDVYETGVRLIATDRFMVLTAWVPNLDTSNDSEPQIDEAPDRTIIAADLDGRGKSLLGYALTLWRRMLDGDGLPREGESIEIVLEFDQRMPNDEAEGTFEGMESRYLVLDVPDTERVWLETVGSAYPDWRPMVREHAAETTKVIRLHPERLERLGKLAKYASGPIDWTFGGPERPALLRVGWPDVDGFEVEGVVMPVRWLTEHDDDPHTDEDETGDDEANYAETIVTAAGGEQA